MKPENGKELRVMISTGHLGTAPSGIESFMAAIDRLRQARAAASFGGAIDRRGELHQCAAAASRTDRRIPRGNGRDRRGALRVEPFATRLF